MSSRASGAVAEPITRPNMLLEPEAASRKVARRACIRTVAAGYEAVNEFDGLTSPPGRGRRAAAGEGHKSMQILRPSPYPLPEGEGKSYPLPEGEGKSYPLPEGEGKSYPLPGGEGKSST